MLLLRQNGGYFVKYQQTQQMVLSMENVGWKMFEDGCVGHKCMDMAVAQPTT
jgi:hypothetical protein